MPGEPRSGSLNYNMSAHDQGAGPSQPEQRRGRGHGKIVGLGGSLKGGSSSLSVLQVALEGAQAEGAETELLDLRALELPMYMPDMPPSPAVERYVETVAEAAGMIWCSPVYHGNITGAFKNALDWLDLLGTREPKYLTDKVIGLMSTAGGVQGMQAIVSMEFTVRALRGWVAPLVIPVDRASSVVSSDGQIRDEQAAARLRMLGSEVARAALKLSRPHP